MNKPNYKKILDHIDREEIVAKLIIGISPADIHDWLKAKYTSVGDKKFILSENMIKSFQKNYLDFYNDMMQDISNVKTSLANNTQDDLDLAVKNNPAYKDALLKVVNNELDIDSIMARMAVNVEARVAQIYDIVQDNPNDINTKVERVLIEYVDALGGLLDKYHKWKDSRLPDHIVQHNVTLQVVDQHIAVFHDVIKEVLSQLDLETSMYFLEVFNEKMSKLKQASDTVPSQETRFIEAKLLNETINKIKD